VPVQATAQSREPVAPPAQVQAQVRPTYGAADGLDDQAMRRMTWDTLSSLNHATGRDSAPGQPGSLLHTIVRRSLDGTPAAQSGASAQSQPGGFYVVKEGDSLVSIAHDIYGDVNMTGPLFAANQTILSRPDDLSPGQTLVLPKP
jgi:nucleoid-associated protein YgaU